MPHDNAPTHSPHLPSLHTSHHIPRRGAAEALGAVPAALLLTPPPGRAIEVVTALCAAATAGALPPDQRDVEARVAAVEALGRLTIELHSSSSRGDNSLQQLLRAAAAAAAAASSEVGGTACEKPLPQLLQPSPPQGLLTCSVVPCLLAALGDYTTDNRGDVGSWVRGAAMEALVAVVPLALVEGAACGEWKAGGQSARVQAHKQQEGAGLQPADELKQPDQQRQQLQQPASGAAGAVSTPAAAVGEMLRIAVERIARLREAAVAHVRQLMAQPGVKEGAGLLCAVGGGALSMGWRAASLPLMRSRS